ncbi:hypothetical protein HPP92_005220 [Vanilla planifolia]|uniref:Uncharacterized protein n=1 Tax=Vanilla planifolia TaxID=51239 RepID=A0A835RU01_VANPL|nr:hypothetical protein HPP92_005220 [Vanilla planifolia]
MFCSNLLAQHEETQATSLARSQLHDNENQGILKHMLLVATEKDVVRFLYRTLSETKWRRELNTRRPTLLSPWHDLDDAIPKSSNSFFTKLGSERKGIYGFMGIVSRRKGVLGI